MSQLKLIVLIHSNNLTHQISEDYSFHQLMSIIFVISHNLSLKGVGGLASPPFHQANSLTVNKQINQILTIVPICFQ